MTDETDTPNTPDANLAGLNLGISRHPAGGFTWVLRDGATPRVQGMLVCPTMATAMADALTCCGHVIETLASQYIDVVGQQEAADAASALARANSAMPVANLAAVPDEPEPEKPTED